MKSTRKITFLKKKKLNVFDDNHTQKLLKEMRKRIHQLKQVVNSHLVIVKLSFCHLNVINILINNRQLIFDVKIYTQQELQKITIFIDIEASTLNFVNINFVKLQKISMITLTKLVKLRLANDKFVSNITHMIQINFFLNDYKKKL